MLVVLCGILWWLVTYQYVESVDCRVRKNTESIALYNSGKLEQVELEKRFEEVLDTQKKLVTRHFLLDFATKAYGYLGEQLRSLS